MSFLSFLFGRGAAKRPAHTREQQQRGEWTRAAGLNPERPAPPRATRLAGLAEDSGSKPADAERAERRELLYGIVRESMMRAGVLSASYKFKVLSVDARGRQFLVLVDLAPESANLTRFAETEALLTRTAKDRHDLDVVAAYWRVNASLSRGAVEPVGARRAGIPSRAAPLETAAAGDARGAFAAQPQPQRPTSAPAPPGAAPRAGARSRFDPVGADEVSAFREALASAGTAAAAAAAPPDRVLRRPGPREHALVDFEDTQVNEPAARAASGLSATQFGDL